MLDAVRPLRRRGGPVHRVRPRRGRRALRDVRPPRRPARSRPSRSRWSGGSWAASCDGALAEPPGADAPRGRAARASPASSTTRSAGCAAPRCSDAPRQRRDESDREGPRLRSPLRMAKPDLMDRVVNLAQATRLRLPVERDLRRLPLHLGLRAARRAAQAQREGRLVALDGAAPRRHRRPRRRDPHGAEGLGGERPPRDVHRPAGRLPQLQGALPRRPAARVGRVPELRREGLVHRGPPVQPDVQDLRRPGGGRRLGRVPAPGDRAGHLRQLRRTCRRPRARSRRSASRRSASRSATRSRPGNFIFRTREFEQMEMEYFVPPEDGAQLVRVLVPGALPLVHRPRHPRGEAAAPPARPRGAVALLRRHVRRGVRRTRGAGASSRASPTAPTSTSPSTAKFSGQDLTYFDQENDRRYVPYVIEPAAGADRATLAFLLAAYDEEDVANGKGGTEKRTVLRLAPAPRADQGRGAAAVEEREAGAGRRRGRAACCGRTS